MGRSAMDGSRRGIRALPGDELFLLGTAITRNRRKFGGAGGHASQIPTGTVRWRTVTGPGPQNTLPTPRAELLLLLLRAGGAGEGAHLQQGHHLDKKSHHQLTHWSPPLSGTSTPFSTHRPLLIPLSLTSSGSRQEDLWPRRSVSKPFPSIPLHLAVYSLVCL
ncbi:hypothetical protein VTK26DRAFT_7373 [Humicola hyalothermophila]